MADIEKNGPDIERASAFGNSLDLSGIKPQRSKLVSEDEKRKMKRTSEEEGFVSRQTTTPKERFSDNINDKTTEMVQLGVRVSIGHKAMFDEVVNNHYTGRRAVGKAMERAIELLEAEAIKQ